MADKISDTQVASLLTTLHGNASIDAKVAAVTAIKSGIKQHNVPDNCVAQLFDALRLATQSQHAALVNAGFTSLGHLLTRLSRQEPKYISKEAGRTLPLIVEKMGDSKEKFRTLASQALTTVYKVSPTDAERFVRNQAMVGKSTRAKETAMQWLLQRHQEDGLQFRGYVPTLMELLEDADPGVREVAKSTVIELFRNASNPAKADLKKQLKNFKVRPAIEQAIVKGLVPTGPVSARPESRQDSAPPPSRPNLPSLSASVSSLGSERPITPGLLEAKAESVEPSYVNTKSELDEIVREMHFYFEGRETEQNWLKREEFIGKLRRLLAGNAASDFPDHFLGLLRGLLDGIIKAISSLRTSLSKEGCSLAQEIATVYGPAMDPMVELLLQTFIKLSASTKKISSQLANTTVDIIVGKATYNHRVMQHIWAACQDKNVQPRMYVTGWLKTILNKEAHHKSHVEHGGGLELVEKCIAKGLNDPNPGVREKMRGTYWVFQRIWPAKAEAIMNKLDPTAQKLLLKDPGNPSSPPKRGPAGGVRPGLGLSKSTMSTSKPSLKDTVMAQKKAALASKTKNLPQRPGSAMSHFSPVRAPSTVSNAPTAVNASSSTLRAGGVALSGVSGAPVRPVRKRAERPELHARPATAGPYSVRGHNAPGSHDVSSPSEPLKSKTATPKTIDYSPKRNVARPRPGHTPHTSETSLPSPSRLISQKSAPSPRVTPVKLKRPNSSFNSSSPMKGEENALEELTLVVPTISPPKDIQPPRLQPQDIPAPSIERDDGMPDFEGMPAASGAPAVVVATLEDPVSPLLGTPSKDLKVYEDPFTDDQATPKPQSPVAVLEEKPLNETVPHAENDIDASALALSPEKSRQNTRLLDSGITRVKAKSLDGHGLRKLQGLIRDNKAPFTDEKFDALLLGLFGYLETPLPNLRAEKEQDVKAQILTTIKLMLRKNGENFRPHVSQGLEALLTTRRNYDGHTHIVAGLELLANDLVALGDASEIVMTMTKMLGRMEMDVEGCRSLGMGLHTLKELIDGDRTYQPADTELAELSSLGSRCLESTDSGVRMGAVYLCVALHGRIGEPRFWDALKGVRDDPKSLITYYVVKRQRERDAGAAAAAMAA